MLTWLWHWRSLALLAILLALGVVVWAALKRRREQAKQKKEAAALRAQEDAVRAAEGAPAPAPAPLPFSGRKLAKSFSRAARTLRASLSGRDFYEVPWYLLIGDSGSGKTSALRGMGLEVSLTGLESEGDEDTRCGFWFYDRGVVVDVGGAFVGTRPGHESAWDRLLRLLERHRPRRPLDGMVLAIPCSWLVGKDRLAPGELAVRGERLYRKLWRAQKLLGMSFPVYVVVTQTDTVPGFHPLATALPGTLSQDAIGWANPYTLNAGFAPEWVNEGFDAVLEKLQGLLLELLADTRVKPSDELFLLPSHFEEVREPLRLLLASTFKESVFHNAFFFRGFWFSGAPEPSAAGLGAAPERTGAVAPTLIMPPNAPSRPKPILFLKQLFREKIFPERYVARPVTAAVLGRNRTAQLCLATILAIAVIGGIGLAVTVGRLNEQVRQLRPVIEHTAEVAASLSPVARGAESFADIAAVEPPQDLALRDGATRLLREMSECSSNSLRYVFIPSSWLSNLTPRVQRTAATAMSRVVLPGMRTSLDRRAWTLLVRPVEIGEDARGALYNDPELLPQYLDFQAFVEGAAELEQRGRDFNGLASSPHFAEFPALAQYTLGLDLPPAFQESELTVEALRDAKYGVVDTGAYRNAAATRFTALTESLASALYLDSSALRRLGALRDELQRVERGDGERPPEEVFPELLHVIRDADEALRGPAAAWIGESRPLLFRGLRRELVEVGRLSLLGSRARGEAELELERAFREARPKLRQYRSEITGPLLVEKEGQPQPQLTPGLVALRDALDLFLNRPFMRLLAAADRRSKVPGARLGWDPAAVERAAKLLEPYRAFLAEELVKFPTELQAPLAELAAERAQMSSVSLLGRAMRQEGAREESALFEESLRAEVENLQQVAKPLAALFDATMELNLPALRTFLDGTAALQAAELLVPIDQMLQRENPYATVTGDFRNWSGAEPAALRAFDVASEGALKDYLDAQREQVRALAGGLAEPALLILTAARADRGQGGALYPKWVRIAAALDGYQKMQPGNSVAALEQFVAKDMMEVRVADCAARLPQGGSGSSADLFAETRDDLRRRMRERCEELRAIEARRAYGTLARQFNERLSGHFPFSRAASAPEAALGDIQDFYRLLDPFLARFLDAFEGGTSFGLPREQALAFLLRMKEGRAAFAPWLESKAPDAVPVYDVGVEFRANRERETGAQNVIDWTVLIGKQKLGWRDKPARMRWVYGEPVAIVLRWAKDAPIAPTGQAGLQVNSSERLVRVEGRGSWALLDLIARFAPQPSDFVTGSDVNPHTLRLVVPTRAVPGAPAPAEPSAEAEAIARLFLRLELRAPEGGARVVLPSFPEQAPVLAGEPEPGGSALSEAR